MRNWIGLLFAAGGAWFVISGLMHRRRVLAGREAAKRRGDDAGDPPLHASLEMLRHIVPGLVFFGLAIVAAQVTFAYFVMDGVRFLSYFDLAAFLFLLAAYGVWMRLKTTYREVAPSVNVDRRSRDA